MPTDLWMLFGNLGSQTLTKGSAYRWSMTNLPAAVAKNQLSGWTYDANGNVTSDGNRSYSYDVENRIQTSPSGQAYSYNPANQRVWDGEHVTFWGPDGRRLGRYAHVYAIGHEPNETVDHPYWHFNTIQTALYVGGRLLAYGGTGAYSNRFTEPVITDRLGSVRARWSELSGGERFDYFPYGEEKVTSGQGRDKFATYLRDSNGIDYANQRYHASGFGMFLTADRSDVANTGDPNSWSRYA